MPPKALSFYFLLALLAGMFTVAFFIFKPFFAPIVLAAVFAIVFQKPYKKIKEAVQGRTAVAAALTTVFILVVIVAPLVFLGTRMAGEATQVYASLAEGNRAGTIFDTLRGTLFEVIPFDVERLWG